MLLRLDEFDRGVICRPNVLEFGAVDRELIDRLDMLLLGALLVIALLDMLLLGARLVIALLDILVLGARFVMALLEILLLGVLFIVDLLEMLLLGARLVIALLELILTELRLDETLLELLEEFTLGAALGAGADLGAGAGLEACRLELVDLLLERLLAAKTGSQNNKRASNTQKTRKKELSRRDSEILTFAF